MASYQTEDRKYTKIESLYEPKPLEENPENEKRARKWHYPVGGSIISSAAVSGDAVYFGSCDKHLYALSTKDGKLLWKFKTGEPVVSSPTVIGGVVYFCGNDGYFYALTADGDILWKYKMSSESSFSSPSIINGKIYFGSRNGYLYCLNLDGKEEWKTKAAGDNIFATPAVVNDTILFTSYDTNFYAFSTDGRLLWKFPMGNSSGGSATIVDDKFNEVWLFRRFNNRDPGKISIKRGMAIFGSWDNHLYALDIDDGRKVWSYIAGGLIASSPPVIDKRVYFGSYDNNFYCLGVEDGRLIWKVRTGGQIASSPAHSRGMICFGSYDQNIYALSLTGEKSWSLLTGGMIDASPTICDNILYLGSFDTYFYAIDLAAKKVIWQFKTSMPPVQMRDQVEIVTETTTHKFTRWKPEVIMPKTSYEFRTESPTRTDGAYQSPNTYQSGVSGSYSDDKKKKKRPELGFF